METKSLNQAGLPRGLIGRLIGQTMVWHNAPDYKYTIELLSVGCDERILEVGFGPGASLEFLAKTHPSVQIVGVDHSEEMLRAANYRNRGAVEAGRMDLQRGSVRSLPFPNSVFDKAFSINCVYFWENPVEGLKELNRVLKPGGILAITVRDKNREAYRAFRPEKLAHMFYQADFATVDILSNRVPMHPLICALGTK